MYKYIHIHINIFLSNLPGNIIDLQKYNKHCFRLYTYILFNPFCKYLNNKSNYTFYKIQIMENNKHTYLHTHANI